MPLFPKRKQDSKGMRMCISAIKFLYILTAALYAFHLALKALKAKGAQPESQRLIVLIISA